MRDGDVVVLFLLLILLLILLGRTWKKTDPDSVILHSTLPIQGKVPNLLEEKGYEVIAEKQRLPLWVQIDEKQFESRLYADYIARRGEEVYVVILVKPKKTLRLSGAVVRDRFLGHMLAFRVNGILYVDPVQETIQTITFDITGVRVPRRRGMVSHLIMLAVGALIAILVQ